MNVFLLRLMYKVFVIIREIDDDQPAEEPTKVERKCEQKVKTFIKSKDLAEELLKPGGMQSLELDGEASSHMKIALLKTLPARNIKIKRMEFTEANEMLILFGKD